MKQVNEDIIGVIDDVYNILKQNKNNSSILQTKFPFTHNKKTKNKVILMNLGRIWFNLLLPEDYKLIDEPVNKSRLNEIIIDLYKKYSPQEAASILTKLQSEAFKLSTLHPNTFEIDIFTPSKQWIKEKEEFKSRADKLDPITFAKEAEQITKKLVEEINSKGFRLQNILESGAKGDPVKDWTALMTAKGYVIDIEGNLLGPINQSINDGYKVIDYYNAASEARRNFFFRSALTANPGYLTTKVVMGNARTIIDDSIKDCKTKRYFEINVNKNNIKLIQQRFYYESGKLYLIDGDDVIGKNIKMRSPLYCISEKGICPICYGNLYKILNTKNVGILAGGAVNVVGVNALMKLRHKSTSVSTKEVNFQDIIERNGFDIKYLSTFFKIEEKRIYAKEDCLISIDENDYDDITLMDCGDKYIIPGILNVTFYRVNETINVTLPIPITVNLIKPEDIEVDGSTTILRYKSGDLILTQDFYTDDYDEKVIMRLFEGGLKYITNPEILVNLMSEKLPGIDLVHLELIVSNMFRDAENLTIPARLSGYKDFVIVGQKKLPFISSWLNALAFENIDKAIRTGLITGKEAVLDPIERVVSERYRNEE